MKKIITIMILSIIAFLNATYLTVQNYKIENASKNQDFSSFCDINNSLSCTNVLSSPYSKVWLPFMENKIPFTAIAMLVYPIIFVIALLGINGVIKKPNHILALTGIGGITFNSYFIAQEFLYIKSFCPLCLFCTAIIITIFILSLIGIFEKKAKPMTFWDRIKAKIK